MNISDIKPNNPTVVIENQPCGEEPINITPDGIVVKKKTNYDKIKEKNPEEFAEWITRHTIGWGTEESEGFMQSWLKWLKEEA